jgi:hypothetical protein
LPDGNFIAWFSVPRESTNASSFSGGFAHIETMTKDELLFGYVDKTGKIVWGPTR